MDEKFFQRIQWVTALKCRNFGIEHLIDDVSGRAFLAISANPNKKCTVDQLILDAIRAECGSATRKGSKKGIRRDVFRNPGNSPQSFRDAHRELRYAPSIDETIDRETLYQRIKKKLTRVEKRVFEELYTLKNSEFQAAKNLGISYIRLYQCVQNIKKIGKRLYESESKRIDGK